MNLFMIAGTRIFPIMGFEGSLCNNDVCSTSKTKEGNDHYYSGANIYRGAGRYISTTESTTDRRDYSRSDSE